MNQKVGQTYPAVFEVSVVFKLGFIKFPTFPAELINYVYNREN